MHGLPSFQRRLESRLIGAMAPSFHWGDGGRENVMRVENEDLRALLKDAIISRNPDRAAKCRDILFIGYQLTDSRIFTIAHRMVPTLTEDEWYRDLLGKSSPVDRGNVLRFERKD